MELRILGPLELVEEGRPLTLRGPRQRALLAILLTRANEVVSDDRLVDELWGARPPRTAANALQYHVSQLRKTVGPSEAIVTREPGYLIRVGPYEFDLLRFEQLVEEARQAPADHASQLLLEKAILSHDPELCSPRQAATAPADRRTFVVVTGDADELDELLWIAVPLARQPPRELILTRLLRERNDVARATAELAETRSAHADRGVTARVGAYKSTKPGSDAALLATEHEAELLLVPASRELLQHGHLDDDLTEILKRAPCDVALLAAGASTVTGPVVTPFGGVEHDWSALAAAAWIAGSLGTTLRLLGTEPDLARGRRDVSRVLGRASLMVQQVVGSSRSFSFPPVRKALSEPDRTPAYSC